MSEQKGEVETTKSHKIGAKSLYEFDLTTVKRFLKLHGPEDYAKDEGIEIPDSPAFLKVKKLSINFAKIKGQENRFVKLTLNDVNVLFCHGESTNNQFVGEDNVSIPELVRAFRKNNSLSAVIVCNTGSYKLDDDLIYPVGQVCPIPSCFNSAKEGGIIMDAHLAFTPPSNWPAFHIPKKILENRSISEIQEV